jgi:uncharacterized protein YegP (UPF0339 family)
VVSEETPKWTFELSKFNRGTEIIWEIKEEIKDQNGTTIARSEPFVNLVSAQNVIETIKRFASTFEVRTVPG